MNQPQKKYHVHLHDIECRTVDVQAKDPDEARYRGIIAFFDNVGKRRCPQIVPVLVSMSAYDDAGKKVEIDIAEL